MLAAAASLAALSPPTLDAKRVLLSEIGALRNRPPSQGRAAVLAAVDALEAEGSRITAPVAGWWTLVYSTQEPANADSAAAGAVQALSDAAYGVFFKFAPALAGAQQQGGGAGVRNEQMVDEAAGAVLNRVRLPLGKSVVEVTVEGECECVPGAADELRVTFTRTSVALDGGAPLRLPLPRPVGTVSNSYCDDDLRVSRGGRGGVFVLRRLARDLNYR